MPKIKKKASVFDEKIIQRFIEKKAIGSADFNPRRLTKEMFAIIALYGSAAVVILILFFSVSFLTSVIIKEAGDIKNFLAAHNDFDYQSLENIIYAADKTEYELNDEIKLSITNGSNRSIFLAPCQYFNKFEKKEKESWKAITLNDCAANTGKSQDIIEKIPQRENQSISAVILGVGVWRGVSDIYMDCQKAEVDACESKKIVFSNEFKIETQKNEAPDSL